ncbi:uncharacterized protein LOC143146180 isoform X2 [Ptiloglossa arizonensis]|uniref:uncharacterized protein LOC143146180 isoform X2 n=1 Tax=Ptiloglossa arizonensis TaxID=3350558 RepID=UPI003F9F7587
MSSKRIRREIEVQTPINIRRRRTNINHSTDEEYVYGTSTKILKQSPRNASSKMHSVNSSRILRTPKKLSLTMKSPIKSEKSRTFKNKKLRMMASPSDTNVSTQHGLLKYGVQTNFKVTLEKVRKSKSTSSPKIKDDVRKFSKSPKIVLKPLNLKFTPKKSPKSKQLDIEWISCNNEKRILQKKSTPTRKSNANKTKVINTIASNVNIVTSPRLISMKDAIPLKKPIVVLQRLSNDTSSTPSLLSPASSLMEMKVKNLWNNSKVNATPKMFNSVIDNSLELSKSSLKRPFEEKKANKSNNKTPSKLQKITADSPLKASTPKEKKHLYEMNNKRKAFNVSQSPDNTLKISNCIELETQQETTVAVENEQNEVKEKDGTYELIEPKTPNLRTRLRNKRSMEEENLNEKMTKKNFKVHFTSPSDTNCMYNLRSQNKQTENSSNDMIKKKSKKNTEKIPTNVFYRRSHSLNNSTTSATGDFTLSSNLRHKSETVLTPFKLPIKTSAVMKIKDLARTKINSKEAKLLQKEPRNGPYNRFGFKLRKTDATNSVMKQRNSQLIRNKQQQKSRAILKGVRTNRRFELQMKSRNIKL